MLSDGESVTAPGRAPPAQTFAPRGVLDYPYLGLA